jgi:hypothetical protein
MKKRLLTAMWSGCIVVNMGDDAMFEAENEYYEEH